MPSLNTILATAPNTTSGYILKATGTSIGNSLIYDNGSSLGISTTTLVDKLTISGGIALTQTGAEYIYSNGGTGTAVNAGFYFDGTNKIIKAYTNNTERLNITSDGHFKLISTSTGGTNLDMYLTENDGLYINSNEGATTRAIYFQTGGTTKATITSAGNLVLNTGSARSAEGSVTGNSGAYVTIFTVSGSPTVYQIFARVPAGTGDANNYTVYATVLFDGSAARIIANNAGVTDIILSGLNVQVRQQSGNPQTIEWKYLRIN